MFIWLIAVFAVVGVLDRVFGNRFGYGREFEKAFVAMGPLALAMVGILCFAPVVAEWMAPIIVPVAGVLGVDPSVFVGIFLAVDMGGFPLSVELAKSSDAGLFSGILLATIVGPTFLFTIPVALSLIKKEDHVFLAKGVLVGLVPVPVGVFVGSVVAGFSVEEVLVNLVPVVVVSAGVIVGLWLIPRRMVVLFVWFGKGIVGLFMLMVGVIGFEVLTGLTVVEGTGSVAEAFMIVGVIVLTLSGAFPFVLFLKKVAGSLFEPVARWLRVEKVSVVGIVTSLAHSIPMFQVLEQMDERGKVMNVAFAVSGAFVLGGHLGFTASVAEEMVVPMIVGKLVAGVLAVGVALFVMRRGRAGV
ncbi:ethanolamine utilization protein EutH [Alteribacter aurantiacus]|uniref:ethanolamine utilization protein EutH n=1 Tax=Alteribacter aurantiacus TaxID=254410 RepID=UPI00041083DC|nr:ethanolamine utilization protein EutH [Alteribacter aurantiacus]